MRLHSPMTLRALMTQRGRSYRWLARAAGCSCGFVSHLCSGRKKTCTPELATRIAEALDVPVELLFGMSTPRVPKVHRKKRAA